jgi:hypothetical protein
VSERAGAAASGLRSAATREDVANSAARASEPGSTVSEDTETGFMPEAVADSTGNRYWSVDDCPWSAVCPNLPDDLVDLLAPPVLVGAIPLEDGDGVGDGQGAQATPAPRR